MSWDGLRSAAWFMAGIIAIRAVVWMLVAAAS